MAIQPVTGKESYWGDVHPTENQVRLINQSPTMQADLQDYGAAVSSGDIQPIAVGPDKGTYFEDATQHRIVLAHNFAGLSDGNWIGALSHELGHFESRSNDRAFATCYGVNPRDPEAFDVEAMLGLRGEGEAIYNNWKVGQEILRNTSTPEHPGMLINMAGEQPGGPTQQALDSLHASDTQSGLSDEQDKNRLIDRAASLNATETPSNASSDYYDYYGGANRRVVPPGLGSPTAAQLGDPAGDGKITSMNETYASGMQGTQHFGADGKLTSADLRDANGNLQQHIEYARQTGGAYSATISDGQGVVTEKDDFDKDGASVAYTYGKDGTQTTQAYDSSGKPQGDAVTSNSPPGATPAASALPESTEAAQTYDGVQEPSAASNTDPDAG
ncbi:hypothetical protein QCE62_31740 [Caballeronia sp. LZ033]|uniref:hypothetical protein n=1 Tax=Caballeronia sp. LZ033 TaxID=3038566 RepID=UPI00285CA613|nr:hypothetical protein [Caballeronia sp. LZ033]MDR5818196.1 hypothetical protein [Caballeronia sp. LZ033]